MEDYNWGWSHQMKSVETTFMIHSKLLMTLVKLDVINTLAYTHAQSEFQAKIWSKIREGDYDDL